MPGVFESDWTLDAVARRERARVDSARASALPAPENNGGPILTSDWTLDALRQREEKRAIVEAANKKARSGALQSPLLEAAAPLKAAPARAANVSPPADKYDGPILTSDWTLDALRQREEKRAIVEEANNLAQTGALQRSEKRIDASAAREVPRAPRVAENSPTAPSNNVSSSVSLPPRENRDTLLATPSPCVQPSSASRGQYTVGVSMEPTRETLTSRRMAEAHVDRVAPPAPDHWPAAVAPPNAAERAMSPPVATRTASRGRFSGMLGKAAFSGLLGFVIGAGLPPSDTAQLREVMHQAVGLVAGAQKPASSPAKYVRAPARVVNDRASSARPAK